MREMVSQKTYCAPGSDVEALISPDKEMTHNYKATYKESVRKCQGKTKLPADVVDMK